MKRRDEKLLTRHLTGEETPEEARLLSARLAREPELERELRRRRGVWDDLELPPAAPAPPGFATRVAARIATPAAEVRLGPAPVWARVAGAAALVAGVVLGASLAPPAETPAGDSALAGEVGSDSLADAYLEALVASAASAEPEAR